MSIDKFIINLAFLIISAIAIFNFHAILINYKDQEMEMVYNLVPIFILFSSVSMFLYRASENLDENE